ncbi:MAG: hypothetical protein ABIV06_00205 [Thermoanaerobaculia bacterium]
MTRSTLARSILLVALSAGPAALLAQGVPTIGPDVTVALMSDVASYGNSGGLLGYMVGTTSCNIGDTPVNWCDGGSCGGGLNNKQHPVIAQGIYRLKGGRLDQVGMSWLKHGFVSTNSLEGACKQGAGCTGPPLGGNQLGVGCTDTYWATLNGGRPMGLRSEVNATTGDFPMPPAVVASGPGYEQRIKVEQNDVDPALNAGAVYWIEGQYVSDNDALAGNALNNASHRKVTFAAGTFNIALTADPIVREHTALHEWQIADPTVEIYNIDIPGAIIERFELARKVTQLDVDTWHYEYAIRNMNSDRAARAFSVDFPDGTAIANSATKSIEHHSGEPYSTTAWGNGLDSTNSTVSWFTENFAVNANANALRWATMFNFWFDADAPPASAIHTLDLFKPGSPATVTFTMPLFADGFQSHNLTAWSAVVP